MKLIFRNIKTILFLPLILIPIGSLLYGIAVLLSTPSLIGTNIFIRDFIALPNFLKHIHYMIQTQFGLIVVLSISIGLSKKSIIAMLVSLFSYFVLQVSFEVLAPIMIPATLYEQINVLPIVVYPFELVGAIIIGVVSSIFNPSEEHEVFETIFQKITPIFKTIMINFILILIMTIVWIYLIQLFIYLDPLFTGSIGSGIYGFIMTLFKPLGISHEMSVLKNYTFFGGIWRIPSPINTIVTGWESVWLAQLEYNDGLFSVGTYTAAQYISSIFVIPAIAFAMIRTSFVEHRKIVVRILGIFIIISMIIGYTFPIELILLFTSPVLFVFNAIITGIIYFTITFLSSFVTIKLILISGGGIFDLIFFGIAPGVEKTGAWVLIILGLFYGSLTHFLFYFLIKRFKFATFGRNREELNIYTVQRVEDEKLNKDVSTQKIDIIIYALGGKNNITDISMSLYRIHITVKDVEKVDTLELKKHGAAGIFIVEHTIQIIYGAMTKEYMKMLSDKLKEE